MVEVALRNAARNDFNAIVEGKLTPASPRLRFHLARTIKRRPSDRTRIVAPKKHRDIDERLSGLYFQNCKIIKTRINVSNDKISVYETRDKIERQATVVR